MRASSLRTHVPSIPEKEERTWTSTLYLRAYSTERNIRTFAPDADSSSISSYETAWSFRASGTMRGSAV
jgi:hypothetical protein